MPALPGALSRAQAPPKLPAEVARVIDGDTIKLDTGERVRLVGVDCPESVHPKKPV